MGHSKNGMFGRQDELRSSPWLRLEDHARQTPTNYPSEKWVGIKGYR